MYLSKHERGILGLYLGLSDDAKWYGIEMKQFFSLVCNICGVVWTVKHAMEHHLLGQNDGSAGLTKLLSTEFHAREDAKAWYQAVNENTKRILGVYKHGADSSVQKADRA